MPTHNQLASRIQILCNVRIRKTQLLKWENIRFQTEESQKKTIRNEQELEHCIFIVIKPRIQIA